MQGDNGIEVWGSGPRIKKSPTENKKIYFNAKALST